MYDVTKEQFFAALYADNRDIMPRIVSSWSETDGYRQDWQTQHGILFGRSWGRDTVGNDSRQCYQLVQPFKA